MVQVVKSEALGSIPGTIKKKEKRERERERQREIETEE
jgi:hypothetical protein